MTTDDIAKRRRAEKIAYAINSIEGVPVSDEVKKLSDQWVYGKITVKQIKKELTKKCKSAV